MVNILPSGRAIVHVEADTPRDDMPVFEEYAPHEDIEDEDIPPALPSGCAIVHEEADTHP